MRDHDLDPAHDGVGADGEVIGHELGVAQVDLDSAHQGERAEMFPHRDRTLEFRTAHDGDAPGGHLHTCRRGGDSPAGRYSGGGQLVDRQIVGELVELAECRGGNRLGGPLFVLDGTEVTGTHCR